MTVAELQALKEKAMRYNDLELAGQCNRAMRGDMDAMAECAAASVGEWGPDLDELAVIILLREIGEKDRARYAAIVAEIQRIHREVVG